MLDKQARINLVNKLAMDRDDKKMLGRAAIGTGLLTIPIALAYAFQRKPKIPSHISEAAKKGVTMVEGKLGKGTADFLTNKPVSWGQNYTSITVGSRSGTPSRPRKVPGLVVLGDPYQAKFIRGDVTLNANRLANSLDDKYRENQLMRGVGKKWAIPTINVSNIMNSERNPLQKALALEQEAKRKGIKHYLLKDIHGADSKGKFVNSEQVRKFIRDNMRKEAALNVRKVLTNAAEQEIMLQKKLETNGIEYRIHTVEDSVVKSLTTARFPKPSALKDVGGFWKRKAESAAEEFLSAAYKKNPSLKRGGSMQHALDVGFTTEGKPIIYELNTGGLSGVLDHRRKRVDLVRQLQGKKSIHRALRVGTPIGLAAVGTGISYELLKEHKKEK